MVAVVLQVIDVYKRQVRGNAHAPYYLLAGVKLVACTVSMYHFISIISFDKYIFSREKINKIRKKTLGMISIWFGIYLRTDATVKLTSYRYYSEVSYYR